MQTTSLISRVMTRTVQPAVSSSRGTWLAWSVFPFLAITSGYLKSQEAMGFNEVLPIDMLQIISERNTRLEHLSQAAKTGIVASYLSPHNTRWLSGHVITVAFRGGNKELHHDIATTAMQWLSRGDADISLDFGRDEKSGEYRQWSLSDKSYIADVRIGFDLPGTTQPSEAPASQRHSAPAANQ